MNQELREYAPHNEKPDQPEKRRTLWSWILLCQVMALGALVMVMALSLSFSHASERHGWQELGHSTVMDSSTQNHHPAWDQPPGKLGGDEDDDEDEDEDEDEDCGTTT